jgi:membrane protease YdiL (CAAX protease family)
MYAALLIAVLLLLAAFVRNDIADYAAFKTLTDTQARQRAFGRWTAKAFAFFGLGSLAMLLLIGRIEALWRLPPEFAGTAAAVSRRLAGDGGSDGATGFILGVSGALVAGALGGALLARWRRGTAAGPVLGDIEPLFPRNAAERRWTALLAANAGPSEELFFRLMLPLLFALATGNALFGFAAASLIFGIAHLYQGWKGVLGTTVAGLLFAGIYLASGSIWLPALLHALVNLNSLWLRPWASARSESAG